MRFPNPPRALFLLLLLSGAGTGMVRAASLVSGGFPSLDVSARATALGGNLAALAGGSESIQSNPSGLLTLEGREVSFTYADLYSLGLVTQTVVNFGWPLMRKEVRWKNGQIHKVDLPPPADRALGITVSDLRADLGDRAYNEIQIGVAFAWRLPAGVRAGALYRHLTAQTSLGAAGGKGHAIDLGLMRPWGPFVLGFAATNLTSALTWDEEIVSGRSVSEDSEPLPHRWSLGLAYAPSRVPLAVTVQQGWIGGGFSRLQSGGALELRAHPVLSLRGAVRRRQDSLGGRTEWSTGAGFRIKDMKLDYGVLWNGRDLGPTHRWSASLGL